MRRILRHPREAVTLLAFAAFTALVMTGSLVAQASRAAAQDAGYAPEFTADGDLRLPPDAIWREWPFIGSLVTPNALNDGNAPFPEHHAVYVEPETWAHYKKTGKSLPEIARELDVDGVVEGSVMREAETLRIRASLIDGNSRMEGLYGNFIKSERISVREVGDDLVLLKYLHKAERYPVVWYFTFYRPPDDREDDQRWVVISVRFDTRLDLLGL